MRKDLEVNLDPALNRKVRNELVRRLTSGEVVRRNFLSKTVEGALHHWVELSKVTNRSWHDEMLISLFPNLRCSCVTCGKPCKRKQGCLKEALVSGEVFKRSCSPKCAKKDPNYIVNVGKSLMQKYGSSTTFGSAIIQEKSRKTNMKRYGAEYYRGSELALKRRLAKIDFSEVRRKSKITMLHRYGVEHAFQNRELFEKQQMSGFKFKEVWLGDHYFRVRGYEDVALYYLTEELNVNPRHIVTEAIDDMPSIPWSDKHGKSHWYHPDIYSKVNNVPWLIEVKSTYTCGLNTKNRSMWSVLKQKAKACDTAGYNFVLLIVEKNKVYPVHSPWLKTRKDIKKLVFKQE